MPFGSENDWNLWHELRKNILNSALKLFGEQSVTSSERGGE